jgi:membrane protein required for colicin V production
MNALDAVLVVLLLVFAIRGLWRGFFRESFGLLGIVLGLAAALGLADGGATILSRVFGLPLPTTARLGVAFVGIFVLVDTALILTGLAFDRVLGSGMLPNLNRAGGALFGVAKGAALSAFVLLFFHLFPVVPGFDERIMASQVGHPMVSVAGSVLRAGWAGGGTGNGPD